MRGLHVRFPGASQWVGLALAVAGLASTGLETVSFGHRHVAGGHEFHHHHFFFGSHEHEHGSDPDHDHDHDDDHEHHHRAPAVPKGRETPWKAAAVSAAQTLCQPVRPALLPSPLEGAARAVLTGALLWVLRLLDRSTSPRGPPSPRAVPCFSH